MATRLEPGGLAPALRFTDLDGVDGHTDDHAGRFIVYSFADRGSARDLMAWRERAHLTLAQKYRDLEVVHINFADLTAVPRALGGLVRPVLRAVHSHAMRRLAADPRQTYILVPDWTGEYLAAFGLDHAATFHCWVASLGKLVCHIGASTRDPERHLVEAFDRLYAARTAGRRGDDPTDSGVPKSE
jgi:hypothetical protein